MRAIEGSGTLAIRNPLFAIRLSGEMNRYQLELVEMDRRRFWRIRILTIVGATALIMVAMWSAGVPSESWFAWLVDEQPKNANSVVLPEPVIALPSDDPSPDVAPALRLISTAPGRNINEGTAQIASAAAQPLTYAAGALLENGTTLIEIHSDHVILARGEETSALYVDGMAENPLQPREKSVNPSLLALNAPGERMEPKPRSNPETYTDILRAAPRFENGTIIGFDVYPGTSRSHFSQFGLQPGDLLIAVDGFPITSVDALHESLRAISEGRSAVATVSRAGTQIDLGLDGALLKSPQEMLAGAGVEP